MELLICSQVASLKDVVCEYSAVQAQLKANNEELSEQLDTIQAKQCEQNKDLHAVIQDTQIALKQLRAEKVLSKGT
jgi:hypothetical protein